jgi:beta-lactamase regulating signal transducer with metallopeptidase domain
MTQWLIDTTLYTGLLIALVLLLRRPVAAAFGPQIAYALWALPLLRLILPPIVLPARFAPDPAPATAAAPPAVGPIAEIATVPVPVPPAMADATFAIAWGDILLSIWLGAAIAFLAWRIVTYRRMRR